MRLVITVLFSLLVFSGCARNVVIEPESTAGTILLIGVNVSGSETSVLGYYYIFDFVDAEDETYQVTFRPDSNSRQLLITELPPGDYTLTQFVARGNPGVSGYASTSLRARELNISLSLEEGTVHRLAQQFTVDHARNSRGERTTHPGFEPMTSNVENRLNQRAERVGPGWIYAEEPVGQWPEKPPARERTGFLKFLFGS
ncbi:MAG: hypothetical protein LAT65_01155 [Saccharospirillum sp.]|nr:hypothetical protein [Saccharospirillum sp.]